METSSVGKLEQIFEDHGQWYLENGHLTPDQAAALDDILRCRTPVLGGYLESCPECTHREYRYNSCSNRNCPKCQWLRQIRWSIKQLETFLPIPHHQVVFTLPGILRKLCRQNKKFMHTNILKLGAETLKELTQEHFGIEVGILSVLHTWNRKLGYHPHSHNCVSCGGLTKDGKWKSISTEYLIDSRELRSVFRKKMMRALLEAWFNGELKLRGNLALPGAFTRLMVKLCREKWVTHVEKPDGKRKRLVQYLSSYVCRIGISNGRIKSYENDMVTFTVRDDETITIPVRAFIGRYLEHVVPKGFHKVRNYGLYSSSKRSKALVLAKSLVPDDEKVAVGDKYEEVKGTEDWQDLVAEFTGKDPRLCPKCGATLQRESFGSPWIGKKKGQKKTPLYRNKIYRSVNWMEPAQQCAGNST